MSSTLRYKMLGDVCVIKPPKKEAKTKLDFGELVSFVPMEQLGICTKNIGLDSSKPLDSVYKGYTYFAENDVLLAKITPCFENGKLGIARDLINKVGFGSSEFIVFRCGPELDPDYLFYYLSQDSFRRAGQKVMTGAVGHKRVPKEFIEVAEIFLPPLQEQKRIVAILDEAFAGIDQAIANTEKNLTSAREIFDSYLNDVFTRKGEGWEEKPISAICTVVNGHSFKSTDFSPEYAVRAIKITNVGVKKFVDDDQNYLSSEFLKIFSHKLIYEGDLVLALTRTIISGGLKVAKVPEHYNESLLNQRVAALRSNNTMILGDYLYHFLCTKFVQDYVLSKVNELMQPNLSIKDLECLNVPVPSIDTQSLIEHQINDFYLQTEQLKKLYKQKLTALNELKQSLLQKAFSGELTVDIAPKAEAAE